MEIAISAVEIGSTCRKRIDNWIDLQIFANETQPSGRVPVHKRGLTNVPGVYFLGLPWLHKLKSSFLHGVGEDAEHLAEHIANDARP